MLKQISLLILCAAAIVWFATPVLKALYFLLFVSGKVTPHESPCFGKTAIMDFMQNHIADRGERACDSLPVRCLSV